MARRLLPSGHDETGKITPLTVAGTEGLLVTYSRCCRPIPDDPIIAYLSAGRGIVIHRDTCGNVEDYHKHPEKWQPVAWQKDLTRYFSAEVRIEAENKIGMLASISAAIAGTGTNIGHATVEQRDGDVSLIKLEVEVKDRKHLARVVRTIRQHARGAARIALPGIADGASTKNEPRDHQHARTPRPPSAPIRRP